MKDDFGDRMKLYEMAEAGRTLMPLLPALARIDGRCFSSFTHGLKRPYDERLSRLMIDTTRFLVAETNAVCGYTQSDEISLVWWQREYGSELFFGGRVQKVVSQLAALATGFFVRYLSCYLPEKAPDIESDLNVQQVSAPPTFDCRVWNVPNLEEAANTFLWREKDATKNSISMAARSCYSHNDLHEKRSSEMQEMLFQKGINWNDYPRFFKRGTFVQRRTTLRKFTIDELEKLPPKHHARQNPDLEIERSEYVELEMPPFGKVTNRVGVIFNGENPLV